MPTLRVLSHFINGEKWYHVYQTGVETPIFKTKCPNLVEYFVENW